MKYKDEDLIGKKFWRLTVQYVYSKKDSDGHTRRYCHCKCECGNEKDAKINPIITGRIKSCGCLIRENSSNLCKSRAKHNLRSHPLYQTWIDMLRRCTDSKRKGYENYGGRGISICEQWMKDPTDFINVCLKKGWKKGLTIDRIDTDGNYEPDNIRFVSRHIQSTNRRVLKNNTSGYTGIYWNNRQQKWFADININRKSKTIGRFTSKKDALDARNKYIIDNNLTEYKIQEWKGN